MGDDMKIHMQNGSILPILTKKTSTISEIAQLLQFACMPKEEVTILNKGKLLNPEQTLENYKIKENDILKAIITRIPIYKKIEKNARIQSIILEAAKISDKRFNMMEKDFHLLDPSKNDMDDDNEFVHEKINLNKSCVLSTEPLPTFWCNKKQCKIVSLNDFVEQNLDSVEEIGQFLEKNDWSSWKW